MPQQQGQDEGLELAEGIASPQHARNRRKHREHDDEGGGDDGAEAWDAKGRNGRYAQHYNRTETAITTATAGETQQVAKPMRGVTV